jgi:hypothetical protein
VVGIIGGFLFLRLQDLITGWQNLVRKIFALQFEWLSIRGSIRLRERGNISVPPESRFEQRRKWAELYMALGEKESAGIPTEYGAWVALLVALMAIGGIAPLLVLGTPANSVQWLFLGPWCLIGGAFIWHGRRRAIRTLRVLNAIELAKATVDEYEVQKRRDKELGNEGSSSGAEES